MTIKTHVHFATHKLNEKPYIYIIIHNNQIVMVDMITDTSGPVVGFYSQWRPPDK